MAAEEQERRRNLFLTATISHSISQFRFPTIKHINPPFDSLVSLDCPLYTRVKQAPVWDHACTGHFEFITHRPGTEEWAQHLNGRHGAMLTLLVQLASRLADSSASSWPDPMVPTLSAPASDAPAVQSARTRETIQREVDRNCCRHACKVGSCCPNHACHSCSSSDSESADPQPYPARPARPECPFGCDWASHEPVTEASITAAAIAAAVSENRPQSLADRMFQQLRASRRPLPQPPNSNVAPLGDLTKLSGASDNQGADLGTPKDATFATSDLHPGSSRSDQLLVHLASCHLAELQFMLSYAHELAAQACLPAITQQQFSTQVLNSDPSSAGFAHGSATAVAAISNHSSPAVEGEQDGSAGLRAVSYQGSPREDAVASKPGMQHAPGNSTAAELAGTDEWSARPPQPEASIPTPSSNEHQGSQPPPQQQQPYLHRRRRTLEMIQYDVDVMCCAHACRVGACCPNHIHHSANAPGSVPGVPAKAHVDDRRRGGQAAANLLDTLGPVQPPPKPSTGCPFLLRATAAVTRTARVLELRTAGTPTVTRRPGQADHEDDGNSDASHDDEALDAGCSPCDGAWDTFVRGKEWEAAAHILSHHLPELVAAAKHNTLACRRSLGTLAPQVPPHLGPPFKGHCYQPGCHLSYTSLPWALMHQAVMHPWQVLRGRYLKHERQAREAALMDIVCPMASHCRGRVKRTRRLARHVALAHPDQLEVLAAAVAGLSEAINPASPGKQSVSATPAVNLDGGNSQGTAEAGSGKPEGTGKVQQAPVPVQELPQLRLSCALCKLLETVSALGLPVTSVSRGYRRFNVLRERTKVHPTTPHSPTTHERHHHGRQQGGGREQGSGQARSKGAAASGPPATPASPVSSTAPVKLTPKQKAAAKERSRTGPWETVEEVKQHVARCHEGLLVAMAAYVHGRAHGLEGGKCPFATPPGDSRGSAMPQSAYSVHNDEAAQATMEQEKLRKTCPGGHTQYEFHTVEELLAHSCGVHAEHLLQVLQVAILLGGAADMSKRPHCPLGCVTAHDRLFMDQYSVLHHLLHGHGTELQQAANHAQVRVIAPSQAASQPASATSV